MYTVNNINTCGGHIMTDDKKYYLHNDGTGFDYWHRVKSIKDEQLSMGYAMGNTSYSYCFRTNLEGCADKLNKLINR